MFPHGQHVDLDAITTIEIQSMQANLFIGLTKLLFELLLGAGEEGRD